MWGLNMCTVLPVTWLMSVTPYVPNKLIYSVMLLVLKDDNATGF